MVLRKRQTSQFKKPGPANSLYPVIHTLPVLGILLIGFQYFLNNCCCFRPSRRIIRYAARNDAYRDAYAAAADTGNESLACDHLHPNATGARVAARAVAEALLASR